MSQDQNKNVVPSQGFFNDMANRVKLILRLMADKRVNPLIKLLPIGSLLYFIIPDFVIGPLDDVAVIWLGSYLFVELCPPYVVEEHMAALRNQPLMGQWRDPQKPPEDVIDGEFWEDKP